MTFFNLKKYDNFSKIYENMLPKYARLTADCKNVGTFANSPKCAFICTNSRFWKQRYVEPKLRVLFIGLVLFSVELNNPW